MRCNPSSGKEKPEGLCGGVKGDTMEEVMMMTRIRKLSLAVFFIGLSLAACTTPDFTTDTFSAAVKSGEYYDGNAHVYAFLGNWHTLMSNAKVNLPTSFLVNDANVGVINRNECMFIDLPPGIYTFSWQEHTSSSPVKATPVAFNIVANQNLFLAFDLRAGLGALIGVGAVGSVADRSGDEAIKAIQDMKIILPDKTIIETIKPMGQ